MEQKSFIDVWPGIFLVDLFRYLITAGIAFLVFWVFGKNHWRHLFIQKVFPKNKELVREFAYSMSTVIIFSLIGFCIYLAIKAGYTNIYNDVGEYGLFYLFISFPITVIFHDFYFYWTHRFMHLKHVYRFVHRVHHESTNPSPWAAYAFHPWEAIIQALVFPIMLFTLPLHPVVLTLFLLYMIVRNVVGHLGFEIFPKGWTKNKWLNWTTAVTHHNIHHEKFHTNFGLYFSWWDRWMKTEDKAYHQKFDEVKSRPKACELRPKKGTITASIILITTTLVNAQDVEGKWTTYNEETGSPLSVIEIVKSGTSIEGRVTKIYLEPFQGVDPVCSRCKGERKDKKVINMNFLWGFRKNGTEYDNGKILDPQNGEVYESKLWLEDPNTLKVRGYGGVLGLLYRTQTWKREGNSVSDSPAGIWNTIDDISNKTKSQVEIIVKNGELLGYVRKLFLLPHEGTDPVCIACEGTLKNAKIIGMKILYDFNLNGDTWESGKILDPGNGNTYSSSLWLVSKTELKVRGYIGPFFRTQIWKRL